MFRAILSILALALPLSVLATSHVQLLNRRHSDLAKRAENVTLLDRAGASRMSFYETNTGNKGSCGQFISDSEYSVALNAAQMNSGYCFKQIRITYGGNTVFATIKDTCPGCPYLGLDLTPGLFAALAPLGTGIIYGDWVLADAAQPATTSTYVPPAWTPTTTSTPWVAPTPTTTSTTWTPKPSSLSSSSVYSSSSSYGSKYSSSAASAAPSGTNTPVATGNNLEGLYQAFVEFGGLILAGDSLAS